MRFNLKRARRAFTLVEVAMTTALASLTGYAGYSVLHIGLMLFAKNSAINVSHQQARRALLRMENDFHSSTSQVQLTDSSGVPLPTSTGPEAGISFQVSIGGPFLVTANSAKGANTVRVNFGGKVPVAQQRLIIPLHRIEADIVSVSGSGPEYTLTLSQALPRDVQASFTTASGTTQCNVQAFLTERVYYTVSAGNLRRHQATNTTPKLLASGIVAATPFRLAEGSNGAFDRKMVAALDLSTRDMGTNALGFKSTNILLNATVPVRQRMAENL
jgi:hypothetical protein